MEVDWKRLIPSYPYINDDQKVQWGKKGTHIMLRPKSQGSGIMVSDFVDERNGYLALTDEESQFATRGSNAT